MQEKYCGSSLSTAAQFLRSPASIFILDFFAVCFIMVLCKLNFAWTIKKSAKQPIFAQKQPIFGLQKSWYPIKSGEKTERCRGGHFRSTGSGATGTGHSAKAAYTNLAEICSYRALRHAADAGASADSEKA